MPKRQTREHGRFNLAAQAIHYRGEFETLIVCGHQFELGELSQDHGLLTRQNPRVLQLGQHALHPIGVLSHIFKEQHPTLHLGEVRGAQQRGQDR